MMVRNYSPKSIRCSQEEYEELKEYLVEMRAHEENERTKQILIWIKQNRKLWNLVYNCSLSCEEIRDALELYRILKK